MAQDSQKPSEWQELTRLTQGEPIVMERVRLTERDIAIEGRFELPQLTRIAGSLEFVETNPQPSRAEVFERLRSGEITAQQAIQELERLS